MSTVATGAPLRASEIFARSQSARCEGDDRCHWCGAPCRGGAAGLRHDDPPPIPFVRSKSSARHPNGRFVCVACWLWRRRSVTVCYLPAGFRDRRFAPDHSWWITEHGAWGLRPESAEALYGLLLKPPTRFVLALREGACDNWLHLAVANDNPVVKADTPLHFTVNNIPHSYTAYELEQVARHQHAATPPGVAALIRLFGPPPPIAAVVPEQRGRGRPTVASRDPVDARETKRVISRSGG